MGLSDAFMLLIENNKQTILDKIELENEGMDACAVWKGKVDSEGVPIITLSKITIGVRPLMHILRAKTLTTYTKLAVDMACGNPLCVNPSHFFKANTKVLVFAKPYVKPLPVTVVAPANAVGASAALPSKFVPKVGVSGDTRLVVVPSESVK